MLRASFGSNWGKLTPGQQHSAAADTILGHEFETLVQFNGRGILEPQAAKSWSISPDWKTYEFEIDTDRRFSDGSHLSANSFKDAWEHGLHLESKSTNHSLLDVLYLVEGFDDFKKSGELRGVEAPSADRLIVHFQKPFRLALDHLAGTRYAVAKPIGDGRFIGTGPFVIHELSAEKVFLRPNKFYPHDRSVSEIEISSVRRPEDIKRLREGSLDVASGTAYVSTPECQQEDSKIGCLEGLESAHMILLLNGLKGRVFGNPKFRLAFQTIIARAMKNDRSWTKVFPEGFIHDQQVFLPAQGGRLEQGDVDRLLEAGAPYIDELIEFTKNHPLKLAMRFSFNWISHTLSNAGVRFTEMSEEYIAENFWTLIYKSFEADVTYGGISIVHGDPDGIYHALGKNGSILSGMVYRERVGQLLEDGRGLIEFETLDSHYQKVSSAILEEVPFVHLGFVRWVYLYHKDRVRVVENPTHRRQESLLMFERK